MAKANPQDSKPNPVTESSTLSTSSTHHHPHQYYFEDYDDAAPTAASCGCFTSCFPWRGRNNNGDDGGAAERHLLRQAAAEEMKKESWLGEKVKKLKEVSEVVAGPKWKNFIRRFSLQGFHNNKRRSRMQFQYDPQSYALNFDDGIDREGDDHHGAYVDFSARFAAPVLMNKV